jgi:Zn finger protein HypA/HybF involved in hydrogenase expression
LAVYHGAVEPLTLCGYHASRGVQAALDAIADEAAAITCESCNTQLNADKIDAYFTPALCDDCNMDRAIELEGAR